MSSDALQTRVGFVSETGRHPKNEDFMISCEADGQRLHETVTVIADGLGGGPAGRFAAESVARGFLDAQEELHTVQQSIQQYVSKTLELGRVPKEEDLNDGGCGHGCGCHH